MRVPDVARWRTGYFLFLGCVSILTELHAFQYPGENETASRWETSATFTSASDQATRCLVANISDPWQPCLDEIYRKKYNLTLTSVLKAFTPLLQEGSRVHPAVVLGRERVTNRWIRGYLGYQQWRLQRVYMNATYANDACNAVAVRVNPGDVHASGNVARNDLLDPPALALGYPGPLLSISAMPAIPNINCGALRVRSVTRIELTTEVEESVLPYDGKARQSYKINNTLKKAGACFGLNPKVEQQCVDRTLSGPDAFATCLKLMETVLKSGACLFLVSSVVTREVFSGAMRLDMRLGEKSRQYNVPGFVVDQDTVLAQSETGGGFWYFDTLTFNKDDLYDYEGDASFCMSPLKLFVSQGSPPQDEGWKTLESLKEGEVSSQSGDVVVETYLPRKMFEFEWEALQVRAAAPYSDDQALNVVLVPTAMPDHNCQWLQPRLVRPELKMHSYVGVGNYTKPWGVEFLRNLSLEFWEDGENKGCSTNLQKNLETEDEDEILSYLKSFTLTSSNRAGCWLRVSVAYRTGPNRQLSLTRLFTKENIGNETDRLSSIRSTPSFVLPAGLKTGFTSDIAIMLKSPPSWHLSEVDFGTNLTQSCGKLTLLSTKNITKSDWPYFPRGPFVEETTAEPTHSLVFPMNKAVELSQMATVQYMVKSDRECQLASPFLSQVGVIVTSSPIRLDNLRFNDSLIELDPSNSLVKNGWEETLSLDYEICGGQLQSRARLRNCLDNILVEPVMPVKVFSRVVVRDQYRLKPTMDQYQSPSAELMVGSLLKDHELLVSAYLKDEPFELTAIRFDKSYDMSECNTVRAAYKFNPTDSYHEIIPGEGPFYLPRIELAIPLRLPAGSEIFLRVRPKTTVSCVWKAAQVTLELRTTVLVGREPSVAVEARSPRRIRELFFFILFIGALP